MSSQRATMKFESWISSYKQVWRILQCHLHVLSSSWAYESFACHCCVLCLCFFHFVSPFCTSVPCNNETALFGGLDNPQNTISLSTDAFNSLDALGRELELKLHLVGFGDRKHSISVAADVELHSLLKGPNVPSSKSIIFDVGRLMPAEAPGILSPLSYVICASCLCIIISRHSSNTDSLMLCIINCYGLNLCNRGRNV